MGIELWVAVTHILILEMRIRVPDLDAVTEKAHNPRLGNRRIKIEQAADLNVFLWDGTLLQVLMRDRRDVKSTSSSAKRER